ncbi:hypothetical protein P175DRAFT_0504148 [Aspergillus ochraceoroseus IBT 24754]|uniref:Uncharacterized protein n=1 Tax=Aspergillus ochraceoroseus IBT 24754 TaxID=1392256 RepID=A0A2T5LPN7_9EURO|nr:uncharacterized protein P175DRAFT_0504148 [Aspergillus ochraceoroseus IBT 24754]PTU18237.1 hypothetical protein P175DRAFT_0504148 [Aspergillus ochraceoroseus IBT 24754]
MVSRQEQFDQGPAMASLRSTTIRTRKATQEARSRWQQQRKDRAGPQERPIKHVPPPEPKLLEVFPNRPPPEVLPPPKGVEVDPKPR